MKLDPRTNKPFERMDVTGVSEGAGSDFCLCVGVDLLFFW